MAAREADMVSADQLQSMSSWLSDLVAYLVRSVEWAESDADPKFSKEKD